MKKTDYLIYRHGSNAANQSMTPVMPVAIVTAHSSKQALEFMNSEDCPITCYNNQYFSAVCVSKANAADWNCVIEQTCKPVDCTPEEAAEYPEVVFDATN